jgi:hypothetical protein
VDQAQRQAMMTGFNNVLRTSTLVGKVDFQRTSLAFAALLQHLPDDAVVVPLGPMYDFLKDQKLPEDGIREVMVFFHSREARFGVRLELPPALQRLTEAERAQIVLAVGARAQAGGTNPGVAGGHSGKNAAAPAAAPATAPDTPAPAAPPAARADVPDFVADARKQRGRAGRPPRRMVAVLALLVVAFVGDRVYSAMTAAPEAQPIELSTPDGLPCAKSSRRGDTAFCTVPGAFLDTTPREEMLKRGRITKAKAQTQGMATLYVFRAEDDSLQWNF